MICYPGSELLIEAVHASMDILMGARNSICLTAVDTHRAEFHLTRGMRIVLHTDVYHLECHSYAYKKMIAD